MIDPGKAVKQSSEPPPPAPSGRRLITAVVFGLVFGFLLQKGGVAKYNVLIGQLLLQDFTVAKIMLTAISVGMLGIFALNRFAKVNLHLQPTRLGAQVIGGLIFGTGFALIAYCPGTGAVALGQGSWDVLFGIAGLIGGSYLYAELSGWLKTSVETWGNRGKITLPDLLHIPRLPFAIVAAGLLAGGIFFLHRTFPR
jgi:uncharacterized membrane protein YedE/YeeE